MNGLLDHIDRFAPVQRMLHFMAEDRDGEKVDQEDRAK
jgi:hypothetical protein